LKRRYLSDDEILLATAGDEDSVVKLLMLYDKYINFFCNCTTEPSETGKVSYYIDEDKKSFITINVLRALKKFKI